MSDRADFGSGVTLHDWGEPEYLDGAQMQYMVTRESKHGVGACLGYFGRKDDAELFAAAKAA